MGVAWSQVALAGLWGGLVAVERRAFLQAMLSRPLVASTVMGLLLGDWLSGVSVGMLLELFFLGTVSLGAAIPDHDTLAATGTSAAAATMAAATGAGSTPALWSLAVLLFIGLGRVGRRMDRVTEAYSSRVARVALAEADAGNLERAVRQNLWGMWPHFVVFGAATALCALAGFYVGEGLSRLPASALPLMRGLAWAYPAMASVAAAIAVQGSHARRAALHAGLAGAVVTLVSIALTLQERR